jgi:acetylornithine deacetylase/succinyl-diaminopimelate desuccinylase-like protein
MALVALAVATGGALQETPAARVARIQADARFTAAWSAIERDHERILTETITLTEIPAPPFKEDKRGAAYLDMLRQHGLTDVEQDKEGNVMGLRRGTAPAGGPVLALVAHLDTVFPEGTDVRVKRNGTRLTAPGVSDNTVSLAVFLALIRAMDAAKIRTTTDLLFVGNVGEEGLGDLRGIKFLMQQGKYKDRIKQVIAVDNAGTGESIVNGGTGSKRYRVTFNGPGGHSYSDFGLVNPAFAMGAAIQKFSALKVPSTPKTTFNVGVVSGGTSVNSIPLAVSMEVDMRSESPLELEKLETEFLALVKQTVDDENRARSTVSGTVAADVKLIGNRPSGQTPATSPLVQAAVASARATGLTPRLGFSSTDANLPISLGIPAIRLNAGGREERSHSLDEWLEFDKAGLSGVRVLLSTILASAGMQ